MELSNSVILPREDFVELQTAAWSQTPASAKDRIAGTVQTTIIFGAMAAAVTAGTWGWAKAVDWREERAFQRRQRELEAEKAAK